MAGGIPTIFDRALYRVRRLRARVQSGEILLAQEVASGLAERLGPMRRGFEDALALNVREPCLASLRPFARSWTVSDPAEVDEERLSFPTERFDLVVSLLSLHATNDLPGVLAQIRRTLRPDGLFLAALFGADTLTELRQAFAAAEAETLNGASPRVAPFADLRSLGTLLQRAGFALPVADSERMIVRYRTLEGLFEDLRALGETNALATRSVRPLSRRTVSALKAAYTRQFADSDGRLRATFDIVYLTGWAPHDSQPKPLKPGTARMSLADALGAQQKWTGENSSETRAPSLNSSRAGPA